mgnify:CR=1 FL=1
MKTLTSLVATSQQKASKMPFSKKSLLILAGLTLIGMMSVTSASAKTVVIDVRTPEEFQVSHPIGALNVPYNQLADKINTLDITAQETLKIFGRNGTRSDVAKKTLESAGYKNVTVETQK